MKKIAFLWHFHQPPYFISDKESLLPFVFLHSIRDYIDFPYLLKSYEDIHMNFNFTPVLLEQIINLRKDPFLKIALKPVEELNVEEKYFLLKNFFSNNWENAIKPIPRFYELLILRGMEATKEKLKEKVKAYKSQDFLDLEVLFYLSWCGEKLKNHSFIKELLEKGSNFKEEEKIKLFDVLFENLKTILNSYKELFEKGQIDITFSPYFHPILPIISSSEEVARDHPELNVYPYPPSPKEVLFHLEEGANLFEKVFGKKPLGLWPSEGSVSNSILNYLNTKVIFSDLTVLNRSCCESYDFLKPFYHKNFPNILIFFRDTYISNRFGFAYGGMAEDKAIDEFYSYIKSVGREDGVVWIILDGENPWGGYQNFGRNFLKKLFERAQKEGIKFLTLKEVINLNLKPQKIEYLFSGSWVDSSFYIWTSDPIKNKAWEMVHSIRDQISGVKNEKSLYYFYAAQGSDWFWWYGKPNYSPYEPEFDYLFRFYLKKAVEEAGFTPPLSLEKPLTEEIKILTKKPIFTINPIINGKEDSFFEWANAVKLPVSTGDAMHLAETVFDEIYFGFNLENLFIRLDPNPKYKEEIKNGEIYLNLNLPFEKTFKIYPSNKEIDFSFQEILEIKIPFSFLGLKEREEVFFFLNFKNNAIERIPKSGTLNFTVPHQTYEEEMWSV